MKFKLRANTVRYCFRRRNFHLSVTSGPCKETLKGLSYAAGKYVWTYNIIVVSVELMEQGIHNFFSGFFSAQYKLKQACKYSNWCKDITPTLTLASCFLLTGALLLHLEWEYCREKLNSDRCCSRACATSQKQNHENSCRAFPLYYLNPWESQRTSTWRTSLVAIDIPLMSLWQLRCIPRCIGDTMEMDLVNGQAAGDGAWIQQLCKRIQDPNLISWLFPSPQS